MASICIILFNFLYFIWYYLEINCFYLLSSKRKKRVGAWMAQWVLGQATSWMTRSRTIFIWPLKAKTVEPKMSTARLRLRKHVLTAMNMHTIKRNCWKRCFLCGLWQGYTTRTNGTSQLWVTHSWWLAVSTEVDEPTLSEATHYLVLTNEFTVVTRLRVCCSDL